MPNGNAFRRDQRQHHRTQLRFANMQMRAQRRANAAGGVDEVLARRAEAEARRRAEEELRRQEAEAQRLAEEARARLEAQRERRRLAQQQQRRTMAEQRRQQAEQARALLQQQNLQQQRARQLALDQANVSIAADHGTCKAILVSLRELCTTLEARLTTLITFLNGSGVPELALCQADLLVVTPIRQRCHANAGQHLVLFNGLTMCSLNLLDQETLRVAPLLNAMAVAAQADQVTINAIVVTTTAAEVTYAAARAHMATYPNLGLTLAVIAHARGPISQLSGAQLQRLNTKLAGHRVQTWAPAWMPASRPNFSGQQLLVPTALQFFPCQPSAEVFHDWVWERAGHGQAAASMREMLNPGSITRRTITVDENQQADGRWVLTSRNATMRIILNAAKTLLITYYYVG